MEQEVTVAIMSALAGGFVGVIIPSFLNLYSASKERKFRKEEAKSEWRRSEQVRKEQRLFEYKMQYYLELNGLISACHSGKEICRDRYIEIVYLMNKLCLVVPPKYQGRFAQFEEPPKTIQDSKVYLEKLANFSNELGKDILEHHGYDVTILNANSVQSSSVEQTKS